MQDELARWRSRGQSEKVGQRGEDGVTSSMAHSGDSCPSGHEEPADGISRV